MTDRSECACGEEDDNPSEIGHHTGPVMHVQTYLGDRSAGALYRS